LAYTVSCHFGSSYSMGHNRREEEYIKNQKHIKKGGEHESIIDHDIADFYRQEFGQAVADYNAREKHADRHIDSYLHKVRTDKKLNECYECIATVGNMGLHPDEQTSKKVLMEFLNRWQTENPNMKVVGAYYHADEEGAPHMHIDFVPVADYKRGLSHRNSYSKAIEQQDGFKTEEKKGTGQIQWQSKMRETLRSICISHGLEVTLEKGERREHSDTEIYKAEKELGRVQSEISFEKMKYEYNVSRNRELHSRKNVLSQEVEQYQTEKSTLQSDVVRYQEEKSSLQSDLDRLKADKKHLQTDNAFLSAEMTQRSRAKEQLEKEIGVLRSELSEMQGTHTQLQSDIVSTQRLVDVWKRELEKQQDKAFSKLEEVQNLDTKIEESKGVLQQLDRSIYQKELSVEQLDSDIAEKKAEVSKLQERIAKLQEHAQKLLEPFKRILEDFKRGLNRADVYTASNEPEKAVKTVEGARDKAYHDLELPEGSQNLTYEETVTKMKNGEKVYLKDGDSIIQLDRDSMNYRMHLTRVLNGQAVAFTNGGLTDESIKQMTKEFVKEQSETKINHIMKGPRRGR